MLDLGAGTGRLTRQLARSFETVFAVEPDADMRALIDVGTVLAGSGEAIPLEDSSVDGVFAGEAFHWFDARRALVEIGRVLVPHGGFAILAMQWWETEPSLPENALALLREPWERFGGPVHTDWDAFSTSPFEPLREESFEDELVVDAETLLAMYSTVSSLAALTDGERAALLTALRPLLAGRYRVPIRHRLSWTRLRA